MTGSGIPGVSTRHRIANGEDDWEDDTSSSSRSKPAWSGSTMHCVSSGHRTADAKRGYQERQETQQDQKGDCSAWWRDALCKYRTWQKNVEDKRKDDTNFIRPASTPPYATSGPHIANRTAYATSVLHFPP
eukprot:1257934-Rhodomonas_salina.6